MSLFNYFLVFSLQMVSRLPTIIFVTAIGLLTLLNYFTAPKYTPFEPPPLPHFLPFFGHAISFIRDQRAFFERANKKANGQPFSMLVAGDKLYIFHRPDQVSLIFRKSSTLRETRTDQKSFRINILGFRERDADKIADLREDERQIHAAHLLAAEALELNLTRYFEELDQELDGIDVGIEHGSSRGDLKRIAFKLVGDILMRSTVRALFGHDSFSDHLGLFQDLRKFLSEHFFERIIGLPNFFASGAVKARERIKKSLVAVVASLDERKDVSGYIQERVCELGKLGLSPEGIVSNEFDIILGSNLNSIPVTYLALLRIITSPDQSILGNVLQDLQSTNFASLPARERAKLVPAGLPHLHALVREVLRFHTTAWSAREVSAPTTLEFRSLKGDSAAAVAAPAAPRIYELQKGAIIAMPSSLLHHDPAIHSDPETFDAKRFLATNLGGLGTPVSSATLRPFGGGISYCPGRLFAEKQIVGFLAAVTARFEIRAAAAAAAAGVVEIPRNADFFYVTRQRDVEVLVRRRDRC